jgi:putative FmdB family regulatory protein
MPLYTYRCENCGIQFDRHQHFDEDPLLHCPECEHDTLRKVYLPVGIVFKGSGFYATDNRSPSGTSSPKKTEGSETTSAPTADKPESKLSPSESKTT